jgi:two-component system, cell cycle sensor histidine kinase and response regulator CckA
MSTQHPAHAPSPPETGHTILVIDDEEVILTVMRTVVEMAGYRVLTAASSEVAFQVSQQHAGPIALVIADLRLADMDGGEVVHRLAAQRPELRVIYMSGDVGAEPPKDGPTSRRVGFLAKPFTSSELLDAVRFVLD